MAEIDTCDWADFNHGDVVEVRESDGHRYTASIELKNATSDVIWVRRWGLWSRHLLCSSDAVVLKIKDNDGETEQ